MNYEIDITRRCNVKCAGCNHLCNIIDDPSSDMTREDVESFVRQVSAMDAAPGRIVVVGGEPTLHPRCIEYCEYIKDNLTGARKYVLCTNLSRPAVCRQVVDLGYELLDPYYKEGDVEGLRRSKEAYHFNMLLSPKEEHLNAVKPNDCQVRWGQSREGCGLSCHRYRGSLKWCWCPDGTSLCKLLRREEFMFPTLAELYQSDWDEFSREICPHCMQLARPWVYVRDTRGRVSECFKAGLQAIKEYNAEVRRMQASNARGVEDVQ